MPYKYTAAHIPPTDKYCYDFEKLPSLAIFKINKQTEKQSSRYAGTLTGSLKITVVR